MMKIFIKLILCFLIGLSFQKNQASPCPEASNTNKQWYQQAELNQTQYSLAFQQWQQAFMGDLANVRQQFKTNYEWLHEILKTDDTQEILKLFSRSVAPGIKGEALAKMLLESFFNRDRRVFPPGLVFTKFTINDQHRFNQPNIRVAGYGGKFKDGEADVELLYLFPEYWCGHELSEIKQVDDIYFRAFPNLHLPEFGIFERDVWPAMVFVRAQDGSLRAYGMSREMAKLIEVVFYRQIA